MSRYLCLFCTFFLVYAPVFSQELKLVPPEGHIGIIHSFQITKDEKYIVSAGQDASVKIWEVASGKLVHDLRQHNSPVYHIAIKPDGRTIVTASQDGNFKSWDLITGNLISESSMEPYTYTADFNADGSFMVVGDMEQRFQLIDVATGNAIYDFLGEGEMDIGVLMQVKFSPDGSKIAAWNWKSVNICSVSEGEILNTITLSEHSVRDLNFSADSRYVVIGGGNSSGDEGSVSVWDVESGEKVTQMHGPINEISSAQFSQDGQKVVSASWDGSVKVWQVSSGQMIWDLQGHRDRVKYAEFNTVDDLIVTASIDSTAMVWDVATGELRHQLKGHNNAVSMARFSPEGNYIVTGGEDFTMKIWSSSTGNLVQDLRSHAELPFSVCFIPSSEKIGVRDAAGFLKIWDGSPGQANQVLKVYEDKNHPTGIFSYDGKNLVTWYQDIKIWDLDSMNLDRVIKIPSRYVRDLDLSKDGRFIVFAGEDTTINVLNFSTGRILRNFRHTHRGRISKVRFAANDGSLVISTGWDKLVNLWDVRAGRPIVRTYGRDAVLSPDQSKLAVWSDNTVRIQNVEDNTKQVILEGHTSYLRSVNFSSDGKEIVTSGADNLVISWDVETGLMLNKFQGHSKYLNTAIYGPEDRTIYSVAEEDDLIDVIVWNAENREVVSSYSARKSIFHGFDSREMSIEKNLLVSVENTSLTFFHLIDSTQLFTLFLIDSTDWVALDREGRFDATPNAMKQMHFVAGNEVIEFEQLKDRFYEPGLVEKKLGRSEEPLRQTRGLGKVDLHPQIDLTHPLDNKGVLGIDVLERGGGIGPVAIWINGKEVQSDARPMGKIDRKGEMRINFKVEGHPYLKPGEVNEIAVRAYNEQEYLISQPSKLNYLASGEKQDPNLHAIIIGSSNYNGTELDLKYAAKDAIDFSNALGLTADKMFGEDHTNIQVLTTEGGDPAIWPTKENIKKAFQNVSSTANPYDVLVVYFSGHGTNYGGTEGDFYYLTSDAASGLLTDPLLREQVAISSTEFTEYFKWIPALKQVMILDACHSGKLAEDLLARRQSKSSVEIRAFERMKDRTGMYVLAGSAADAVSYETSVYGQGLLTYSILFGMKGASLRENRYVDVMQLFQFAADNVPDLAANIGGIQRPEIRVPYGGQSFDIGLVTEDIQEQITLPSPKPLFLRSTFSDEETFDDHLRLSEALDDLLSNSESRGADDIIFIDASRYSGAYSLKGRYVEEDSSYKVKVRLFEGDNFLSEYEVVGNEVGRLAEQIIQGALERVH